MFIQKFINKFIFKFNFKFIYKFDLSLFISCRFSSMLFKIRKNLYPSKRLNYIKDGSCTIIVTL